MRLIVAYPSLMFYCRTYSTKTEKIVSEIFSLNMNPGDIIVAEKIVSIHTSRDRVSICNSNDSQHWNHLTHMFLQGISTPEEAAMADLERIANMNFASLLKSHQIAWRSLWIRAYLEVKLQSPSLPTPVIHNEARLSQHRSLSGVDPQNSLNQSIELSQPFLVGYQKLLYIHSRRSHDRLSCSIKSSHSKRVLIVLVGSFLSASTNP